MKKLIKLNYFWRLNIWFSQKIAKKIFIKKNYDDLKEACNKLCCLIPKLSLFLIFNKIFYTNYQ